MSLSESQLSKSETGLATESGKLGLWDTVGIIIGIVVGTSIFSAPPLVFQNVNTAWEAMGVWLVGGIVSLFGALCYAELATTYPKSGGDYHYLTKAYGRPAGFLFGWAQLCVILTGSIGCMAFAFADYTVGLWGWQRSTTMAVATTAVLLLTGINLLGVMAGKWIQNLLTIAKVVGLLMIVTAGFVCGQQHTSPVVTDTVRSGGLGLAMVFVFYAYGGWNDAAFVTADVRNVRRNIPLSLIMGVSLITCIYLAINGTFLWALGLEGARQTWTPATDVLQLTCGPTAATLVTLLVIISALGAINGLILTGSRIFVSLGEDHRVFASLSSGNGQSGTPSSSLLAQAVFSVLLMALVGTAGGQFAIDRLFTSCGMQPLPWQEYHGGFETLVAGTAPVFWFFLLLTGIAQFVLRVKDRDRHRPFVTPFFPIPSLVFCGSCIFMLYMSVSYAKGLCLIGIAPVALGLPIYWFSCRTSSTPKLVGELAR